ncbi:hypothetical protein D1007_16428 [Hordeum vulgare]|uniref:ubiquitinyl hydrolase 1 n=1 Tax=Hordeum vulgare subsp. vulgare TaxID=112509 RepID=A0A8I7BER1_HORVV|nr:OVARIAN TUMOR DOMAIN-containing deubiquitinating enzyme 1-like [Hordeum vulgare subsp. vulgare]KAE8807370.1 hypothetical protein D1007_16428 [Hordeum vulgare]KAI4972200.1 hypothetical protein ZWY2020_003125 [Hordeum vulgare]
MAGSGGSPDADYPNCGGGGAEASRTPQESDDRCSPPASPLSTRPSGQPPGTSVVANEGSASSSAWGSDDDEEPTDRYKNPAAPSTSTMGASSSSSSFSSDSWIGSDRTYGGASTSNSLDASNHMDFYRAPPSGWMYNQILESPFWSHEACDAVRPSWRDEYEYEACDDFSMVLQASQNGCEKVLQKEPLSSLPHEFENEIMKDKAKKLSANYSEYRKIPRDGSCFYRSFIYSYLEQLVKVSHEEELRLLAALEPMWEKFQRLQLPGSYSDLHNAFVGFILECMEQKQKPSVSGYQEWLFQESQNEQKFASILLYLRLVTAIEICTKFETFKPYISDLDQGEPDAVEYCLRKVLPEKEDAEQVNLTALTNVLQVSLRVVNIDVTLIAEPNIHIIYESPDSSVPTVTLLYRPGHYDIIYEKS